MTEGLKQSFGDLVADLCKTNMDLWREEDKARVPDDHAVAAAKRNVDKLNQKRNNLIEAIDDYIIKFQASKQGA
jgi:hypothetical protein